MKLYNLTYFFREGIHSIFTHRFMSVGAMSVICACLLLMGSFSLVTANVDMFMEDIEEKNQIVVYVDKAYNEEEARAIEDTILKLPEVTAAEFTTKQTALEDFRNDMEEYSELLEGIDERNPLRHRYTITLRSIEDTNAAAQKLGNITGIAKVSARGDIAESLMQVRSVVTIVCGGLILILVLMSIFIISNTVNLTMFNRREEIAIMKMIGATNGFVRVPFIIEGLVISFVGAGLALLLQWGLYEFVVAKALSSISFISAMPFSQMTGNLALMFFGTGALVGGLGSAITLRKFLKV